MRQVDKKTLTWLAVGVGAYILLDMFLKKKQTSGSNDDGGGGGGGIIPGTQVVVGKNAFALTDDTKVRSSASVNNGTINNIVGILKKDEVAGKIQREIKNADGNIWYLVNRMNEYACPFSICGLTRPYYGGYVRSDVVRVA